MQEKRGRSVPTSQCRLLFVYMAGGKDREEEKKESPFNLLSL